jgi:hypothetical protein
VLETLLRHPTLPAEVLQGDLRGLSHEIRLEAAQPEGVLRSLSDFWGSLGNQLRPAINLVATLELDLQQVKVAPLVFGRVTGYEQMRGSTAAAGRDRTAVQIGGLVRRSDGSAYPGAAVRLIALRDGQAQQAGNTVRTDAEGRYLFPSLRPGRYTLVVEAGDAPPQHRSLDLQPGSRKPISLPDFTFDVAIPDAAKPTDG